MEQKKRMILAGLTILVLVAVACAGTAAYCHYSNDSQQTIDDGNTIEFYPTDGTTTITLGNEAVPSVVHTGMHFIGWSTDETRTAADFNVNNTPTTDYVVGSTIALTSDNSPLKLYAIFAYNTCTVNFNAHGGTGDMAPMTVTYGSGTTLTACAFKYVGYDFTGWNTQADGNGVAYIDGASVDALTSAEGTPVTLYAQWTAHTYKVDYSGAGTHTTLSGNATVTYGNGLTINYGVDFTDNSASNTGIVVMTIHIDGVAGDIVVTDNGTGSYVLDADKITGDVTVTTKDIHCYSVSYYDGDTLLRTCSYYTLDSNGYSAPVLDYNGNKVDQRDLSYWTDGWWMYTGNGWNNGYTDVWPGDPLNLTDLTDNICLHFIWNVWW